MNFTTNSAETLNLLKEQVYDDAQTINILYSDLQKTLERIQEENPEDPQVSDFLLTVRLYRKQWGERLEERSQKIGQHSAQERIKFGVD